MNEGAHEGKSNLGPMEVIMLTEWSVLGYRETHSALTVLPVDL